jgi:hypothetical protein
VKVNTKIIAEVTFYDGNCKGHFFAKFSNSLVGVPFRICGCQSQLAQGLQVALRGFLLMGLKANRRESLSPLKPIC